MGGDYTPHDEWPKWVIQRHTNTKQELFLSTITTEVCLSERKHVYSICANSEGHMGNLLNLSSGVAFLFLTGVMLWFLQFLDQWLTLTIFLFLTGVTLWFLQISWPVTDHSQFLINNSKASLMGASQNTPNGLHKGKVCRLTKEDLCYSSDTRQHKSSHSWY